MADSNTYGRIVAFTEKFGQSRRYASRAIFELDLKRCAPTLRETVDRLRERARKNAVGEIQTLDAAFEFAKGLDTEYFDEEFIENLHLRYSDLEAPAPECAL